MVHSITDGSQPQKECFELMRRCRVEGDAKVCTRVEWLALSSSGLFLVRNNNFASRLEWPLGLLDLGIIAL